MTIRLSTVLLLSGGVLAGIIVRAAFGGGIDWAILVGLIGLVMSLYLIPRIVEYFSLPKATIQVDGQEIRFRYCKELREENYYGNLVPYIHDTDGNSVLFDFLFFEQAPLTLGNLIQITQGDVQGTLFFKGETYPLSMYSGYARCSCSRQAPCWEGTVYRYVAFHPRLDSDYNFIAIELVQLKGSYNKKTFKKHTRRNIL